MSEGEVAAPAPSASAPLPARTRIGVVDDHTLFRDGLREILEAERDFEVVGEAGDGVRAVELAASTAPDVLLMDVGLPDTDAASTVRRVLRAAPGVRVVMVSMYDEPGDIVALLGSGARGYLLKTVSREDLVSAVRAVMADSERIVLSVSRESMNRVHSAQTEASPLSGREREVITLVAQGMTNAQTARRLAISEGTVKHHLRNVFAKLGATSRIDAVNKAAEASLIGPRRARG
ncbi:response regulator [Streptomyces sp. NPDC048172]|uniref:response regulator n=1 Tax=Streptomyces sp. NPDC048172 TaxID=3365505 RepID=UPI0037101923